MKKNQNLYQYLKTFTMGRFKLCFAYAIVLNTNSVIN